MYCVEDERKEQNETIDRIHVFGIYVKYIKMSKYISVSCVCVFFFRR